MHQNSHDPAEPRHLFVYGTLLRRIGHPMHDTLVRWSVFTGRGRTRGTLYDLGEYPGLVPGGSGAAWVRGELYAFEFIQPLIGLLDRYEGCTSMDPAPHEFRRAPATVETEGGERCFAWMYRYEGSLAHARPILDGDYAKERTMGEPYDEKTPTNERR